MATFTKCIVLGSAMACVGMLAVSPVRAQTTVLLPTASIGGIDQATLSQQWWNWAVSYPPATNPILDPTGASSSLGDKGSYFFLAGTLGTDPVIRNLTVRNDQTLFFPLANSVAGYTDEQIVNENRTLSSIRSEATNYLGVTTGLFLKLNGSDLPLPAGSASLLAFRQPTGQFDMIVPSDDNIFGGPPAAPAGTYRSFSDGYWVGLAPFANGNYELHFGGNSALTGSNAGFTSNQDITYRIAVVPEPGTSAMLLAGLALIAGVWRQRRAS